MILAELSSDSTLLGAWLQSLGFHNGNPFGTNEADRERSLLPGFFIDVESYDLIKGNQTVIVFAPRGGGKSSLRVVLASYGAPWSPKSSILAVECTDFDPLIDRWQNQEGLTIRDHVNWLLPLGVKALFDTYFYEANFHSSVPLSNGEQAIRISQAAQLSPPVRLHFARLLHTYCNTLLNTETLGQLFSIYAPEYDHINWLLFNQAVEQKRLGEFISEHTSANNDLIKLLTDLNDFSVLSTTQSTDSPKALLADFLDLVRKVGFTSVHFLLDRLDETSETAENPQAQADILEPLLAHLPILEMPGAAFKFFLSQEARDVLWERPSVRQEDRLAEYAVTLKWDENRLKRLLTERLSSYSAHPVSGTPEIPDLATICVEDAGASDSVGEKIETAMIARAQGSPRRLLIAGRLLFEAHLLRHGGTGQVDWEDWLEADKSLLQKSPPLLRVNLQENTVLFGQRTIKLSKQEGKIIDALIDAGGRCSRDELATAVWGQHAAADDAMDQAVNRLRIKLGDNAANPIYLKTIRGQGFELTNYELA